MWPTESETTYFLKDRTTFIRYYFDEAAKPFVDIHERIDAGTSPFESLYVVRSFETAGSRI